MIPLNISVHIFCPKQEPLSIRQRNKEIKRQDEIMFKKPYKEIDKYCSHHSTPENEILKELAEVTQKSTIDPGMMVGHIEGAFLKMLVRISGAERVLEIGTFTGYSALAMAEGLSDDGVLITCDRDKKTSEIAQHFWAKSIHGKKITQILGNALEILGEFEAVLNSGNFGPLFDLVFIDADKKNSWNYWNLCIKMLRPGGIMAVDNVLRGGSVISPDSEGARDMDAFNKKVKDDDRVEVLMLPVRDGVTVAIKK